MGKEGWVYKATVLIWISWVLLEIILHNHTQFLPIILSFFFFQSLNLVLYSCFSTESQPIVINTSVSLVHSSFTSYFVVFILVNQWRHGTPSLQLLEHHHLVQNTWPWAYQALCFSCGYFAYDQWDMLNHGLFTPSILAHHFILLLCFSLALYRNFTINYLILTLFCELHSVFLHMRKLRRMAGIRNAESAIVKLEWVLNWVTFIFARLIPHVLILIKLVRDAPKFDKGIALPLACFGMIGMNALNIGLGIDLLGACKREISAPRNHHRD